MAITVVANPATLSWSNFVPVPAKITDPNDRTLIDALTRFNFNMPALPPRTIGPQLALADPLVITITPNSQVWTGVRQTAALLSHEQLHYDVGIVTGRALARQLMQLRAPNLPSLVSAVQAATRLHFTTRAGVLQSHYDQDTGHGTNAHQQKSWKDRMTACLANPLADQLAGFLL
jgi:hypothetical protein